MPGRPLREKYECQFNKTKCIFCVGLCFADPNDLKTNNKGLHVSRLNRLIRGELEPHVSSLTSLQTCAVLAVRRCPGSQHEKG